MLNKNTLERLMKQIDERLQELKPVELDPGSPHLSSFSSLVAYARQIHGLNAERRAEAEALKMARECLEKLRPQVEEQERQERRRRAQAGIAVLEREIAELRKRLESPFFDAGEKSWMANRINELKAKLEELRREQGDG
ncbi:MAG: hypothetical protein AB1374_04535 [Bacillota bacterium]